MDQAISPLSDERYEYRKPNRVSRFSRHWPLLVWIVLLMAVNIPLFKGDVRSSLLYLPEAVEFGQWWRIITYPLVHLSFYHLILDAGGFLILYTCLEDRRTWAKACYLAGPALVSLGLALAVDPALHHRGLSGLSGVAHGLMAVTALEMVRHKDQRSWGLISLSTVVGKSAYELLTGEVFFEFMHMGLCGHPIAASHAGGVIGGLLVFLLIGVFNRPEPEKTQKGHIAREEKRPRPFAREHCIVQWMVGTLARLIYRVRYEGLDHIPVRGPAVLVCNHVSYVDWLIIASACNRPVHFVMHAAIFNLPVLNWIFRLTGVIPIDSGRKSPAVLRQAFKDMAAILDSGGLICIFPEGHLTRTGQINRFRPGIERIIRNTPVPVIPLALRGLWGSIFSHRKGGCHKLRAPIDLSVGSKITPRQVTAAHLQHSVQALHGGNAC